MNITVSRRANFMESEVENKRPFDHRHIGVGVVLLSLMIPSSYGISGLSIIFWGDLFSFPIGETVQYIRTDLTWAVFLLSDYLFILTPHVFLGTSIFSAVSLYNHRSTRVAGIIHAVYFGLVILFSVVYWIIIGYLEVQGFVFFLGGLAGLSFLYPSTTLYDQQTTNDQPKETMNPSTVILLIGMVCLAIWGFGIIGEGLDSNVSPIYLMPYLCMVGGPIFIVLVGISLVLDKTKKPKD
jgi:hypothetical protein